MRLHKHIVLVALGAAFLALTCAAPAVAVSQDSWYTTWNSGDASPHGGYGTNTTKCAVCHAVHNASGTGEVLLRTTVADACTYCHVDALTSLTPPIYGGSRANYDQGGDLNNAHNWYSDGSVMTGTQCTNCHSVHAAEVDMTLNDYLTSKLLKGEKVQDLYNPTYDPRITDAPNNTDSNDQALTKWCTQCHKPGGVGGIMTGYYTTNYGEETHVMRAAGGNHWSAGVQVAWAGSENCGSCHSSQYSSHSGAWPHYTQGVRFLESGDSSSGVWAAATDSSLDGVCLRCHVEGGNGVSHTF